jgi:hypothetical protein
MRVVEVEQGLLGLRRPIRYHDRWAASPLYQWPSPAFARFGLKHQLSIDGD